MTNASSVNTVPTCSFDRSRRWYDGGDNGKDVSGAGFRGLGIYVKGFIRVACRVYGLWCKDFRVGFRVSDFIRFGELEHRVYELGSKDFEHIRRGLKV